MKAYAKLFKSKTFSCRGVIYSVSLKCLAAKQRTELNVLFKYLHKSAVKLKGSPDTILMEAVLFA